MPSINEPLRHTVSLTEDEIDGLITTIGRVRIADVHACRIKAVHTGMTELKNEQAKIRIQRGD
jgi:hypothetical protein